MKHYRCQREFQLFSVGMLTWDQKTWDMDDIFLELPEGTIITQVESRAYKGYSLAWKVLVGDLVGWVIILFPERLNEYFEELQP